MFCITRKQKLFAYANYKNADRFHYKNDSQKPDYKKRNYQKNKYQGSCAPKTVQLNKK